MGEMFKKPQYIALALVAVTALIIFNLPAQTMSRTKLAFSGFFVPLFGLADSSKRVLQKTGDSILPRGVLTKENEQLRRENQQLKVQLMQNAEITRENARLRTAVGWQKQTPWKLKLARVIARDPSSWWRTIQIDVGSQHGIRPNLPVLVPEGLVGRISAVGATRSQVLLLGDPNMRVGALVQDKDARENGIVISSSSPLEQSMVTFQYFSRSSVIKPGQNVITSGEGGVFPKGIPIGQIVDIRDNSLGLSTDARVRVSADLNSLEEVLVMFP